MPANQRVNNSTESLLIYSVSAVSAMVFSSLAGGPKLLEDQAGETNPLLLYSVVYNILCGGIAGLAVGAFHTAELHDIDSLILSEYLPASFSGKQKIVMALGGVLGGLLGGYSGFSQLSITPVIKQSIVLPSTIFNALSGAAVGSIFGMGLTLLSDSDASARRARAAAPTFLNDHTDIAARPGETGSSVSHHG